MNHSAREVENAAREKERTVVLHESQMKRAKTMVTEATTESADQVLHHPDVIEDIDKVGSICAVNYKVGSIFVFKNILAS